MGARGVLRVAMVGHSFMGAVHSQAWRSAGRFFDLPLEPQMSVVVGRRAQGAAHAAAQWGWQSSADDWRTVISGDDVDLVDICTPGDTHADIAIAALRAGKHVLCEKPLANSVAEAEQMAAAAKAAGTQGLAAMVGFTYRRTPALKLAQELIGQGRIGVVRQVRAAYLQDWLADENAPLTWRLDAAKAGSGALGDIGAHIIDATQFLTGQRLVGVSGLLQTFVAERPVSAARAGRSGLTGTAGVEKGPVTVDDAALFFGRLESGASAIFEASRVAWGRKNSLRLEVSGSSGSIAVDLEEMNVLNFYDADADPLTTGFTRILVTEPEHPYVGAWWPPGHGLGYEHGFTHQVVDLVNAIASGAEPSPSFADGLQVQRVLAAVQASAAEQSRWLEIVK